ncbi:MAG: restriction endonuclease subunit S [Oligoflexia bacterium]|nr:restriction endonuclease subunit S [Oligoflexia bacterium]
MKTNYNKQKNKSYPSYRDSGVEWLGKIPTYWNIECIKRLLSKNEGGIWGEDFDEDGVTILRSTEQTIDGKWNIVNPAKRRISSFEYNTYRLIENDLVITKSSGSASHIGKTSIVTKDIENLNCCYSNFMQRLRVVQKILPQYVWYIFNCEIGRKQFDYFSTTTTGLSNLNSEIIGSINVAFPSLLEQKTIINFLDKETSRIDSLIQKKEKQIELLKEKRSALITQAVTKGLNPNVKIKDSGIEWLGKIPEHWEVKKLRYVGQCQNGISKKAEYFGTGFPFLSYSAVYNFLSLPTKLDNFIESTEQERKYYSVLESDIFFTRTSETIEDIGFTSTCLKTIENSVFSGFLIRFRPKNKLLYKGFSKYYFRSDLHRRFFVKEMNLVTRTSLSQELLKKLPVLLPPLQEQKSIASFLDKETSRIDSLIEKIKKSIDLLKEYRSALITSTVTGKIDVHKSQIENIIPLKKSKSLKPIETKKSVLIAKASSEKSYFKSMPEKSPRLIVKQAEQKPENSLFKKTVLGAEIVAQLKDDPHFGRTKFMKTLYLCEAHLQIPLKGTYKRSAAGPLDNDIYRMEGIMKKNKWFEVIKAGSMYKYKALENSEGYKAYFDEYWGNYKERLNQLLPFAKKFTTEQSEIVNTIYSVWNDFLIEGKTPSDNEIVNEVKNNWHKSKKRFSAEKLKKAIQWMKEQNFVPQGYGPKTKKRK